MNRTVELVSRAFAHANHQADLDLSRAGHRQDTSDGPACGHRTAGRVLFSSPQVRQYMKTSHVNPSGMRNDIKAALVRLGVTRVKPEVRDGGDGHAIIILVAA